MSDLDAMDGEATDALQARRLTQISLLVSVMLAAALVNYVLAQKWEVAAVLALGIATMGVCLLISKRGNASMASTLLLGSITLMASGLMWLAEGLHDVMLLTYPVILIMGGILVKRRVFLSLLIAMLVNMVVLTVLTDVLHWRVNKPPSDGIDFLRDAVLILLASGFAVWVIAHDLQTSLARLREQIGAYHASQKELTYLSQHDGLTGLPNRALGRERIEQAIIQSERHRSRGALLFVDLDNFKTINDTMGHAAGDDLLKQVAKRLLNGVRKTDIVSRHGGDEFVLGLSGAADLDDIAAAAASVQKDMAEPFRIRDAEVVISCSIGISTFPDDGLDYESLLRQSDMAMYQAKESGRNAVRFFNASMNERMQVDLLMSSGLRAALVKHEFVLHYQPVFDLASGRLVGAEALIRWQHPERGLIAPLQFIPAAEKSGLIVEIGAWVLQEACRQVVAWQRAGWHDFVIAVNLSAVQFRRGDIDVVVADALQRSGLPAACLELEITESTLVQDIENFILSLQRLKKMGVRLSIDDFGTGYSNLSYLQRFAVDRLKIDRSFVSRLHSGPQDRAIVNAIIQMAKSLALATTAEGIEDAQIQQLLLELGCDQGQGYFFARPLSAEQFGAQFQALAESDSKSDSESDSKSDSESDLKSDSTSDA